MFFVRLGEVPPPLWSVLLCLAVGAFMITQDAARLGIALIVAISIVTGVGWWRRRRNG